MPDASSSPNYGLAFGLTCAAGMSTCLGAAAVYNTKMVKLASKKVLASGLGISAGVMAYVSFIEIFPESLDYFEKAGVKHGFDKRVAYAYTTLSFFAGVVLMKLIDAFVHFLHSRDERCMKREEAVRESEMHETNDDDVDHVDAESALPSDESPRQKREVAASTLSSSADNVLPHIGPCIGHCGEAVEDMVEACASKKEDDFDQESRKKLVRMGLNTAVAIAIHNFPEGLATFFGTLDSEAVGASLAVAIGIHNIPEGLCVAIPVYYATGNRHKAFLWAFLSGISEPIGAAIGWLASSHIRDDLMFGITFGIIAGMMVSIVVHELLPTAHRYDPTDKVVTNTFVLGMVVMSLSLVLFMLSEEEELCSCRPVNETRGN